MRDFLRSLIPRRFCYESSWYADGGISHYYVGWLWLSRKWFVILKVIDKERSR